MPSSTPFGGSHGFGQPSIQGKEAAYVGSIIPSLVAAGLVAAGLLKRAFFILSNFLVIQFVSSQAAKLSIHSNKENL